MNIDPALFQENERTASQSEAVVVPVGSLQTESGGYLANVDVAYMTFGNLSARKDNVILVCHALSGNANCQQWWERLIGPGKSLDTDRYFVIGTNALGGCNGSTGPASLADDGKPYGSRFPMVTVGDMVEVQKRLIDHLGIQKLHLVCGGSMGGMQAIEWSVRFPDHVGACWATASSAAHNAMQIGFNEAARQAVMRDSKWNGGDYDPLDPPSNGLAVARMIGHLSFLSESAFEAKFGRRLQNKDSFSFSLDPEFQVESYLSHQGNKFTQRFDANSLLVLTRAIDYYDCRSLQGSRSEYLFTSFTSDWLYPPHQSQELHAMAEKAGCTSHWHNIDKPYGHDAFLLDGDMQGKIVADWLAEM